MDYSIFYKSKYDNIDEFQTIDYDLFISAYNSSHRVQEVFKKVSSENKHWIILSEYDYSEEELLTIPDCKKKYHFKNQEDESSVIRQYFDENEDFFRNKKVCIDITGFLRPHLIFLIRYLALNDIRKVDFIYSDPETYVKKEETRFSESFISVKQITGFQGNHNPETDNDLLIIGSGYDHKRISDVAKNKANARKVQLFGFPSLQPDMFQENIIRAYKAEEASMTGDISFIDSSTTIFSPANDPFITANMISDFVKKENKTKRITNLYLSPLSTKAQALGFALFYIYECIDSSTSIVFPFYKNYTRETSRGITKIWKYTVEFPILN